MAKTLSSTINTLLSQYPLKTDNQQLYAEYIRIYNALNAIQFSLLQPAALVDITREKLSTGAKAGRLYLVTQDEVTYGDWVYASTLNNGIKKLTEGVVLDAWYSYQGDSSGYIGENMLIPLFVTTADVVQAGNIVEVTNAGIVWTPQALVPGTMYALQGQTLVPRNTGNVTNLQISDGSGGAYYQRLVGYALSEHHIILRRFS